MIKNKCRLNYYEYAQYEDTSKFWRVNGFELDKFLLITGKNATGKTRLLNTIFGLAQNISSSKLKFGDGNYHVKFDSYEGELEYKTTYKKKKILSEEFILDNKTYLTRNENGEGEIYSTDIGQPLKFKVADNVLVVASKYDSIQHPYLTPLIEWARDLFFFAFDLNQSVLISKKSFISDEYDLSKDVANPVLVYSFLHKSNPSIQKQIIKEMAELEYYISSIDVSPIENLTISNQPINQDIIYGLKIKEKNIACEINQYEISTGMFRTLSLLMYLNYYCLHKNSGCILIDGIGEGLDDGRSKKLIKLLMKKIKDTNIQLILTSNVEAVINLVPLEKCAYIIREKHECFIISYKTDKKIYDSHKFTGLSNYDFFTSNAFLAGHISRKS